MNPDPVEPRVPLMADDPLLQQLEMMAESDPEILAWLEKNVYSKPDSASDLPTDVPPTAAKANTIPQPSESPQPPKSGTMQ